MHRLTSALLAGLMAAALTPAPATAQAVIPDLVTPQDQRLSLESGKGSLIRLPRPAASVFVANPDIADVQIKSPRLIYVLGGQPGETTLYALDERERTLYAATVGVTRNLARLKRVFAELMPTAAITPRSVEGMLVLTGRVQSPSDAAMVERYAKSVTGAADVINQVQVIQPSQVNLRVKFAEVSRSILKQLGFNWNVAGSAASEMLVGFATGLTPVLPGEEGTVTLFGDLSDPLALRNSGANSFFGRFDGNNFDANAVIDALDSEGFLTVLAEPNLTAISGETAAFLAGGEFPVPLQEENGLGIEFKQFGVSLAFTPIVLDDGRINIRVEPEVSELSNEGAVSVNGFNIPGLSTRRLQTTVELGSGQSFAIAGLIENSLTQDVSKLPGLGDIPILGALFSSNRFQRNETELLVVVTPYIVRPVAERRLALPTDNLIAPSEAERLLLGKRFRRLPSGDLKRDADRQGRTLKGRAGFSFN